MVMERGNERSADLMMDGQREGGREGGREGMSVCVGREGGTRKGKMDESGGGRSRGQND